MPFEQGKDTEIFSEIEVQIKPSDFAILMLITQGFYQTRQDLDKNAQLVASSVKKGSFVFKNKAFQTSVDDLIHFNPEKYGVQIASVMNIGHKTAGLNPSSLRFLPNDQIITTAVDMIKSVKEKALNLINN